MFNHVEALLMEWAPIEWRTVLHHCHEWPSVGGDVRQEVCYIIHQSYEPLYVIVVARDSSIYDAGQLARIGVNSLVVNDMA